MLSSCVRRISKDGDFPMASHAPLFLLENPSFPVPIAFMTVQTGRNNVSTMQTAEWAQNVDWVRNAECRLQTSKKRRLRRKIVCFSSRQYNNLPIVTPSPFQGHLPRKFRTHVFVLEMGQKYYVSLKCGSRGISPWKPKRFSFNEAFLHAWWVTLVEVPVLEGFC